MGCTVIIAAAGAGKTERLIEEALAQPGRRVLFTTYTNRNAQEIRERIVRRCGVVPSNIQVETWFSFLLRDAIKPYQTSVTTPFRTRAINFDAKRSRFAKRGTTQYYFDGASNLYSDSVADLACLINQNTCGMTINRLQALVDIILIDEMQDLAGYDLDFIDLIIDSPITLVMVGDPRQATYSTNDSPRHKQYRGFGLTNWITERAKTGKLSVERMNWSRRCNELICRFADALFPDQPGTQSRNTITTDHDGIYLITDEYLRAYTTRYRPMILRWNRRATVPPYLERHAANIGEVKGCTFDRVVIFPTRPMLKYLTTQQPADAGERERFYVATTRARYSVAFVIKKPLSTTFATIWTPSAPAGTPTPRAPYE